MTDDEPKCGQQNCDEPPMFRYTWPGKPEAWCCFGCRMRLSALAAAMGMPEPQMIRLTIDDYVRGGPPSAHGIGAKDD